MIETAYLELLDALDIHFQHYPIFWAAVPALLTAA